ncbi:MAG TPA: cupin domain-containing protein [Micromonospora sp.]
MALPYAADHDPSQVAPTALRRSALARCVAIDEARFATEYWGRAPLLSRAADLAGPEGFADLFSPAAADELLSRRGLRTPFLRVANRGRVLPERLFAGSGGAGAEIADQVLDERVLGLYVDGATLVFQGLHRVWPPVVDFARELGETLGQPVQVNAYLTPAGNQGFATHYDTHDVFVLQVDGRKQWRIHPPVWPHPLESQPWGERADEVAAQADGPPAMDICLAPGDALYLPRGWLHSAQAQQERSLHVTVGVRALTRYALVEEVLALAAEEPELRTTLPFGVDVADPHQIGPEVERTVALLRDWLTRVTPQQLALRLRDRSWPAWRPAPIRPLAQAEAIRRVGPESRVMRRPGLRYHLDSEGDRVALRVFDRVVTFPAFCASALQMVLSGAVCRVGDVPGLADDHDRIVLVRRLLREAILVPAD